MCTIWAVSLIHAASDATTTAVRPALVMGRMRGSAVNIAVVAISVGRVLGNRDVEGRRYSFSSSKIEPKSRECGNVCVVLPHRTCSLVLFASSASAATAVGAAGAAAVLLLVLLGVFFLSLLLPNIARENVPYEYAKMAAAVMSAGAPTQEWIHVAVLNQHDASQFFTTARLLQVLRSRLITTNH